MRSGTEINRFMVKLKHTLFVDPFDAIRKPPFLRFWLRKTDIAIMYGAYDLWGQVPDPNDLLIAGVRLDDETQVIQHTATRTTYITVYGLYPDQPAQDIMQKTASWQTWCQAKYEILKLSEQVKTSF